MANDVLIAGGGIFGITAAIALRKRGRSVTLIDPGQLPHPLAESTDISKVVRLDYGPDEAYLTLMEEAIEAWRRANAGFARPLFHETGVAFLSRGPMTEGSFENESYRLLTARGHRVERLDESEIRRRFPAWRGHTDGYYNPVGGYAESGNVVAELARQASGLGVVLREGARVSGVHFEGSRAKGLLVDGQIVKGSEIVVAAGSWTPTLLPELSPELRAVGQPVFHLLPKDPSLFAPDRFPVFGADISKTGYYGFPVTKEGIVKIANHGVGREIAPGAPREVLPEQEKALRVFLSEAFPDLAGAPLASTRLCVYCDSHDEHFWITRDPAREGLTIAAGGSGHGFKFAPILGDLIADAMEGADRPILRKFAYRPGLPRRGEEASRHHETT